MTTCVRELYQRRIEGLLGGRIVGVTGIVAGAIYEKRTGFCTVCKA